MSAILRTIKFNDLAKRSCLADFVDKIGTGTDFAGMLAAVMKRLIRLIALMVAFDALGLLAISDVLRRLLLWLPNVVVALVMLVIGGLLASALSNVVRASAAGSSQDVKRRRKSSGIGIKKAGKIVARSPRRPILQATTSKTGRL